MVQRRSTRSILLWLVLAATTLSGAGCRAWGTDRGAERIVPIVEPAQDLRVTRTDGRQVILHHVVVSHDTLFGTVRGTDKADETKLAIPLGDITRVERRKVSRSSLAVAGGIAAFGLGLWFLLHDFSLETGFPPAT